jgi:DNA-directed RNA polymerase subunit omega
MCLAIQEFYPIVFFLPTQYIFFMIFPLEKLIEYKGNMYEITCASSRRAYQLSMLQDEKIAESGGKVVSLAAAQVFSKEIEFRSGDSVLPEHVTE